MASPNTVIAQLNAPTQKKLIESFASRKSAVGKPGKMFSITGGIRPVDLYCYLHARFGPPNGIQNLLKRDDSDNMVHWNYTLTYADATIDIMALNYRIDVMAGHAFCSVIASADEFVEAIKRDFSNFGPAISKVRQGLERWHHFLNPYARLSAAINQMFARANELLSTVPSKLPHPRNKFEIERFETNFRKWADAYSEAIGLCQSVRMLAPVVAESLVNLILFTMLKPDLKKSPANYDTLVRQHIDDRVKNLHLTCSYFIRPVDWSSPACKDFNSLMNRRNDYLHGNILPTQTSHEIIYFNGKTPIFSDWRDFYDRCFGSYTHGFSIKDAERDLIVVEAFRADILDCMDPKVHPEIKVLLDTVEIGFNEKTGRMGKLLSEWTFDFFADISKSDSDAYDDCGAGI